MGHPEDVQYVQKYCTPHNTNAFAMKFAEEILESPDILSNLISKFKEGRGYLLQALEEQNYLYQGEAGNFLFIKPKGDAKEIVQKMKEEFGILIKSYPSIGKLGDCLRVTIGEKKYMEQFMEALVKLDRNTSS